MHQLTAFLLAGTPPHWLWMLFVPYAALEFWLGRTNAVSANSVLALVAQVIGVFLGRFPGIGPALEWVAKASQPQSTMQQSLDAITKRQTITKVGTLLVLFGVFLAGCGHVSTNQVLTELEGGASLIQQDCLPGALSDYNDVQTAIHSGGANWVAVAMDAVGCLEPMIMAELKAHHVGGLALLDRPLYAGAVVPPSISRAELRRMRMLVTIERAYFATKVRPK